jgi:hypothetical protein
MTTKLPHADLICEHAQTGKQIWLWSNLADSWLETTLDVVMKFPARQYAIGDKPTAPPPEPVRYAELGGIRFPVPMAVAPAMGTRYWFVVANEDVCGVDWEGSSFDLQALATYCVHATQEGAELCGDAQLAALAQACKAAMATQSGHLAVSVSDAEFSRLTQTPGAAK